MNFNVILEAFLYGYAGAMEKKEMSSSKWIGPPMRHTEGRALYQSCEIESGQTVCIGESGRFVYLCSFLLFFLPVH